jgi:group II intron reverse transcriptase/maturase
MTATQNAEQISPRLLKVMERAKRDPETRFLSLVHLIDEEALSRAYGRLRKQAAVGVDGVSKEEYGVKLAENVTDLYQRLRGKRWRHQPIRRVHIPKGKGRTRPIGISTVEDKIVQVALSEVLTAVYEPVFRECSYGFRPGRSPHDALRALKNVLQGGETNWVLEADIESFFDSIDRTKLMEMLRDRVVDRSLLRLVGRCLHVGVLEGTDYSEPEMGTVQGSGLSPLLGNIYLHHVLDMWFEREVLPRMRGKVRLIRFADDFVVTFEREEDARKVMRVVGRRFERYGLRLHPEKTRLLPFGKPPKSESKGSATFDFLGFTHYWGKARNGYWIYRVKTRKAKLRQAVVSVADWCRRHRYLSVKEQHAALTKRLVGHANYFAVSGNSRCIAKLMNVARRVWHKWLNRRSQRARLNWKRFNDLLRDYPFPGSQVRVQLWPSSP